MKNKESDYLLDFFLTQQAKLDEIFKETNPDYLSELRSQAEKNIQTYEKRNNFNSLLQENQFEKNSFITIPHYILDQSFADFLGVKVEDTFDKEQIAALFTPIAKRIEKEPSFFFSKTNCFFIHSGFFSSESDIYRSVAQNFKGMFLFANGKDHYELQLLTEIGRDFGISILFVASNLEEVNEILKTDAPYLVISAYHPKDFQTNLALPMTAISKVPNTCRCFCLAPPLLAKESEALKQLGFSGLFSTF
ncbi:MAG: hypothetical protein K2X39_07195 [Silvanigrellaceae bacterium]|nr:hypothetical protein [Silvanigrellaceae bacterium]